MSSDVGGRLQRMRYPLQKNQEDMVVVVPEYNSKNKRIRDTRSRAINLQREGKLCYLRCSRYPDCRFEVLEPRRIVLLKDKSQLADAQFAYRNYF